VIKRFCLCVGTGWLH